MLPEQQCRYYAIFNFESVEILTKFCKCNNFENLIYLKRNLKYLCRLPKDVGMYQLKKKKNVT